MQVYSLEGMQSQIVVRPFECRRTAALQKSARGKRNAIYVLPTNAVVHICLDLLQEAPQSRPKPEHIRIKPHLTQYHESGRQAHVAET